MYNDPVEIEKINAQQAQLNIQIDVWLTEFENKAAEEEKDFDEKEEKEDNRLTCTKSCFEIFSKLNL
jgi:regulator of RNase E activity RraB